MLESDNLFGREEVKALRGFDQELRERDGVLGAYSIFDARARGLRGLLLPGLLPREGASDAAFEEARAAALGHPLVGGLLLSKDALVMVIAFTSSW